MTVVNRLRVWNQMSVWQSQYKQFMLSPAWRSVRQKVLHRDGYLCQNCGARATQVHHVRYDRGWDNPEALVSLSRDAMPGFMVGNRLSGPPC
jgi:5-methylcytosine-specific restriction endonuclease McrA